jgi:hypothetical protein
MLPCRRKEEGENPWLMMKKMAKVDAHYQNRTDDLVITSDTLYH